MQADDHCWRWYLSREDAAARPYVLAGSTTQYPEPPTIEVSSPSLSFPRLCKKRIITPVLFTHKIVFGANELSPSLCTVPSYLAPSSVAW